MFIRACEKYGRNDIESIASEMEGKTEEEVERYAKVFKERYKELNGMCLVLSKIFLSVLNSHIVPYLHPNLAPWLFALFACSLCRL